MAVQEIPAIRERGTCCPLPVTIDQGWAAGQAALLKAMADPTRLSMLAVLREAGSPVCICDFTGAFGLSQPTISHHMGRLRGVGLVESERSGIWIYYRLRRDLRPEVAGLLAALLP